MCITQSLCCILVTNTTLYIKYSSKSSLPIYIIVCDLDQELPWWISGKEPACQEGEPGPILGSRMSMEKATAPHASTLAWRIPQTEEPGGLQSTGSLRVRHD